MAWAWKVSKLLTLVALLPYRIAAEDEDEETEFSEALANSEDATGSDDIGSAQTPSSVYVMEHGVLGDEWMPRGTIMLSGHGAGYEARLSDAKEFVQMKPQLQQMITKAAGEEKYYAIRMYNPASPKRTLQAAIPMKLLADHFEDWHDILEVSVSDAGIPVALSYRVKHTLGLMLFDHTQVHLSEPSRIEGPRVQAAVREADGSIKPAEQPQQQSFLRRYWWVIAIAVLLMSSMGDDGHLEIPAREDAMFQVLVEGVGRMYPSIEGANLSIRHELLGPEEAHHDAAWFLDSARSKRRAWIFVACPQSCAVCLGWKFQGEEIPKETEDWREMGPWLISSHIGQGKQGAVVCTGRWPSAGKGGVAAVKYPVEAEELELYARVHDIPGLPDLLDFGRLPGPRTEKGEFYMAMSKIEPCLDILLRGQLHIHDTSPQTLGRISWPVVAGMGLRLLRTLQAIHKRGILHCDLKPGNILLHRRAPHVQLIDLGRAGYLGRTAFKAGEGGMRDYMSIKAGLEGGQRTSADDVESLGWFLLRLLLGRFPWSAKVKPHPDETWLEGGVRVARDKLRFLEEGGVKRFAPECRYCPPFLLAFLRRSRAAAGHVLADAEYETLAELLVSESGNGNLEPSEAAEKNLEQFVSGYFAARDEGILRKGMWPYAGGCTLHWLFLTEEFPSKTAAMAAGIKRLQVSPGLLLRLTGEKVEIDDCVWMELDPVWSPGVPELLLKPGWVLAIGSSPQGGRVETWVEWGLEFPVVEHVKGVLDKSE